MKRPTLKPSVDELAIAGVRCVSPLPTPGPARQTVTVELECILRGHRWRVVQTSLGFLNSDYWRCPKGCNTL